MLQVGNKQKMNNKARQGTAGRSVVSIFAASPPAVLARRRCQKYIRRWTIVLILFLLFSAIASLPAANDPVALRFSDATVAALNDATDTTFFRIEGSPPPGRFLKEEKRFDLSELQGWLRKQRKGEKELSSSAYLRFKDILFDPENHYQGIFNVFIPPTCAIAFRSKGTTGYIVIYQYALIAIVWEGHWEAALLNDTGRMVLEQWNKDG